MQLARFPSGIRCAWYEPGVGEPGKSAQNLRLGRGGPFVNQRLQNCWEFKKCGREPGGARAGELGICPAATCDRCDGVNGGSKGGRVCWAVAGTLCQGNVRGTFAQNRLACTQCDFLDLVEREMGPAFRLVPNGDRVEDVIRASEDRYRRFFDEVPVGLFRCSADGAFIDVNPALTEMLGHAQRDTLLGLTLSGFTVDVDTAARRAERLHRDGELHDFEMRLRRTDGTVFWARESSHLVIADDGELLHQEGILQDISETRLAREQARANHILAAANQALLVQFRETASLVDALNAAVYVADIETHELLYLNRYAAEIFGDNLGRRCYEVLQAGKTAPCSFCTNGRLLVSGKPGPPVVWEFQNTITGRWYMCIDKAIPWTDGRMVRMEAAVDISDRKRAEQTAEFLAEASKQLAASLDNPTPLAQVAQLAVPRLADWCIIELVDDEGTLRPAEVTCADTEQPELAARMRQATCWRPDSLSMRVLRTGQDELINDITDEELVDLACSPEHLTILQELVPGAVLSVPLRARERTFGVLTLIMASSRRRYGEADLALAEEVGRRASLAIANTRLYGSARAAVRARDETLAIVSHDLRSPLSAIMLNVEAIDRLKLNDEAGARAHVLVRRVQNSARRMDRLIHDLLDAAAIESGKFAVEPRPNDVVSLIDEALQMMQPLARDRKLRLETHLDGVLRPIHADRGRLLQVLSNLVGNAIKFTPEGGQVRVAARDQDDGLLFSVADTGPGIADDVLPHVFDRYWQAHRARRSGAGLGLYIVRGIVEAHGGTVWAESRPGEGSTFYFTVPGRAPG